MVSFGGGRFEKPRGKRVLGRNADRTNDRGYIRSWQLGVALYFDK